MQFPLDILVGYFTECGLDIRKRPLHGKHTFTWVSALQDEHAPSINRLIESSPPVYVMRAENLFATDGPRVVLVDEGENDLIPLDTDDIAVACDLDAHVVADRLQRYIMGISQWNDLMGTMLDDECICQDLLRASEPILRCYVGLSDSSYSYIAHTPSIAPIDTHSQFFVEHRFYSPETIALAQSHRPTLEIAHRTWIGIHDEPDELFVKPCLDFVFQKNGAYAAHLILVSPRQISESLIFLFDLLARRIGQCLVHHWRLENPLEQRYTYFLKELLSGNVYGNDTLAKRANMHGLPLEGLFELALVDSVNEGGSIMYFAKQLINKSPYCKVAIEDAQVVVLLCSPGFGRGDLASVEEQLLDLATSMQLDVGLSDRFEHLTFTALALDKARIALEYGRRKSRKYDLFDESPLAHRIFRFRRYVIYYLTDPYARTEQFVSRLISSPNPLTRLKAYDREHDTHDFEILRTYLYNEGSIKAVCETLHMHRNTVNYRLEKIRSTTNTDFYRSDNRTYLRMLYMLFD